MVILYIFITILFGALIIGILILFDLLITDGKTITFVSDCISKTKIAKNHAMNENYKDYLFNLKYENSVAELPFSVVQPLLHSNSPIVYRANKNSLVLAKDKYHYNKIYIKLSKKDYKEYYNYLIQKEENKKHIEQTENTLAATKLIQAELNRINEEALKTIETEKEKIENITNNLMEDILEDIRLNDIKRLNNIKQTIDFIQNNSANASQIPEQAYKQSSQTNAGRYYINQLGQKFWIDNNGNWWLSTTN